MSDSKKTFLAQIVAPVIVAIAVGLGSSWVGTQVAVASLNQRVGTLEKANDRRVERDEMLIRLDQKVSAIQEDLGELKDRGQE